MSICISSLTVTKWVPLISVVQFTLSGGKQEKERVVNAIAIIHCELAPTCMR